MITTTAMDPLKLPTFQHRRKDPRKIDPRLGVRVSKTLAECKNALVHEVRDVSNVLFIDLRWRWACSPRVSSDPHPVNETASIRLSRRKTERQNVLA